MEKIKSLLLPLALVFAAIAVFETGARYGSTNMRAYAIAEQLQISLQIAARGEAIENTPLRGTYAMLIDNEIASGAMQRRFWYLDKMAKTALDKSLTYALSARGPENVIRHFEAMKDSQEDSKLNPARLAEVIAAIREAKVELIDHAPDVAGKESKAATPEATAPDAAQ